MQDSEANELELQITQIDKESLGVVAIDSDVSSSDFHTDKSLMEDDTEALSEVNDSICAVGSDTRH